MSFDGIVTKSVVHELKNKLTGGRIDKVYQQENDEILLKIYSKGKNYKLVLSANSNNPRVHLTSYSKENPMAPPMFCMLLRKHLIGGSILNISQSSLDRVVSIDISAKDELGQPTENRIIIEVMGKHSNIILMNKQTKVIIDSVKRVYEDISRVRQIMPGIMYFDPPVQDKSDPLLTTREDFYDCLSNSNDNLKSFKFLYTNFLGLSPLISREICFDSSLDIDRTIGSLYEKEKEDLFLSFSGFMSKIKRDEFNPILILNGDKSILAFHALDIEQFGDEEKLHLESMSDVLDIYYNTKDNSDRINQKSNSLKRSISVKLDRASSKLGKQKTELLESEDREQYKIYADLISANLHSIPKGEDKIELENFYDENLSKLNIPLNIKLSPVQNAQKYYKKYSKLKNAHKLLLEQIPETQGEIDYLENVIVSIDNSTKVEEIQEIKEELIEEGYIKASKHKGKTKKNKISSPHHFISRDNIDIYVGKNNRQNDYLTFKFSNRSDIWMHVQKMPGSHVIIQSSDEIPDSTLEDAAILAAYYSKGKDSKHVNIDYTERKNVKKPKGAKAGMVIYDNFKTINVNPNNIERINTLKQPINN